jgi:hypothetical protein
MRLLAFLLLFSSLAFADSMNINGFNTSETQIGLMKVDFSYNGFSIKASLTDGQPISRNGTDGTFDGQVGWLSLMSGQNITLCGVLLADTIMNVDLNSSGTCFTFGVDNIYLDCAGHTINGIGTDGSGVFANGRNNILVKNCEIYGFSGGNSFGLHFISTSNSNVTGSIFRNIYGRGVYFQAGSGNRIINTISRNNNIENFNLITTSSVYTNLTSTNGNGAGIIITTYGGNIFSNIISSNNRQYEIWIQTSPNNVFDNVTITSGSVGFYFVSDSPNNLVANSSISAAISISSTNNVQNNKLLNTTFDASKIVWGGCSPCNFSVSWYGRVNVTNSTNAPLPANVNVSDINGKSAFSSIAGASGLTPWFTILDYYASSAGNTYFNNYSINASYPGYNLTQSSFNFGGRDYTFNMTLFLTGFIPALPINITYGSLVEVFRDLESRKSSEFPARNYFLASLPLLGLAFVGLWKKDWLVS